MTNMAVGIIVAVITWLALLGPAPKPGVLEMRVVRWQAALHVTPGTLPYRRLIQVF
jgi:hypothetical protein